MLAMLVLIVIALLILFYLVKRPPNLPPGPLPLPFVGNLPELKRLSKQVGGQHLALLELAKRYKTNVLGLTLGNSYVVAVFSHSVIREVLLGEEYEGRPDNFFLRLRCMGRRRGITCTDGSLWNIQRNFVVRHLRNLGFGKRPMEVMIREELSEILTVLKEKGSEVQVGKVLAPAVINILWTLITGMRTSLDNPKLQNLLELLERRSKIFDMSGGTLSHYPWLRFVASEKTGFNLIQELNKELASLFMETILLHEKTWYEGRNSDLIYSFITEMKQANGNGSTFTHDQLVMVCLDLFIAGAQTTSNTLDFALLMMILHPEMQKKVQQQLDERINVNSCIEYTDRYRLPYAEAVLLEVERYCHVTPIIGPRRVLRDTTLDGYFIPKDTTVLISVHSVHNDKEYWKDSEVFRPERFLDERGFASTSVQNRLIPFGLGKRRCLGESLARNCIFLFFTEILRKYNVSLLPGSKVPTGVPLPGITLSPEKYRAQFSERIRQ